MTRHCLVFGDFNFPNINWYNLSASGESCDTQYEFQETVRDCFWWHHMLEPTHGRGTDTPSLLDLVFSNEEGMINDICIEGPCDESDHTSITFTFVGYIEKTTQEQCTLLLDKITEAVEVYVQKRSTSSNSSCNTHGHFPMNRKLKEKIKKKESLQFKFRKKQEILGIEQSTKDNLEQQILQK